MEEIEYLKVVIEELRDCIAALDEENEELREKLNERERYDNHQLDRRETNEN